MNDHPADYVAHSPDLDREGECPCPKCEKDSDARRIALRLLKPEKTDPGYDEGWNDALYLFLDVLEDLHSDGSGAPDA